MTKFDYNHLDLVTIITPCHNDSSIIKDTIESVINQTYTNWEMIIVDDGSIDDSKNNSDGTSQFCTECGNTLIHNAKFCGSCGTKITS